MGIIFLQLKGTEATRYTSKRCFRLYNQESVYHSRLKYLGHKHRVYGYDGSFEYIVDSRQEVLVVFNGGTAHFLLRHKELSLFIVRNTMNPEAFSNALSCP